MRFADSFHKRIYRISKFNSRELQNKDKKKYEVSTIKLPTYIIYSLDFGEKFGYYIEKPSAKGAIIFKKIVFKEPKNYIDDVNLDEQQFYIEFTTLESILNDVLKETDEHESKLLDIASQISKRIT